MAWNSTVERLVERVGSSYFGKYRGIVTDVDDPNNQCRIRATVPAVLGEQACGWAMPASPFAGDGHGFVMLPEGGLRRVDRVRGRPARQPDLVRRLVGERRAARSAGRRQCAVIVSEKGHKLILDDDANEVKLVHGSGPEITMTATEITLTCGACEIKISNENISLNNGLIKVGLAGVSLVNGAMTFGVPP